jgi:pyrroloquinoline quinone (PQQ) biosynthesis protein C
MSNAIDFNSAEAYVVRKDSTDNDYKQYMNQMVEYILNHRGLEHPFFNYYAKNGLAKEKSKILYLETRHYFKYLPFYICGMSTLVDDDDAKGNDVIRFIAFNTQDELGDSYSHSDMYKDFMFKKGITATELDSHVPLPSTVALNEGIRTLYSTKPLVRALGALFADETLSAALVSKYNQGLIQEGLSAEDRHFWELHCEWEVGHSNAVFNMVEPYVKTDQDRRLFAEGVNQYLYLMEGYWNGIEHLIGYP